MPINSKNKKKKSKSKYSKQHNKNDDVNSFVLPSDVRAEVYDDDEDYPTSRVIKSTSNGDVIVEPLNTESTENNLKEKKSKNNIPNSNDEQSSMASILDTHWESLSPEAKKNILRIDKEEVFEVIKRYQSNHNCNCSVCGRRHMAMDQEMERIYNMLYEIDRIKDPVTNPVKFHLGIIKELQLSKSSENKTSPSVTDDGSETENSETMKNFLSSNNVDSLKEEVMHFKQNRQKKQIEDEINHHPIEHSEGVYIEGPKDDQDQAIQNVADDELKDKYMNFTKNFISSHPKLAEEYVRKIMMYPDMKALTDELMNYNSDKDFVKAMEEIVSQKMQNDGNGVNNDNLGDPRAFTTMLHNGTPLTPQEYAELQLNIADRMTSSYDTKKREFKAISPLEKELFTRFMLSDNKKQFEEIVMQSFRDKFVYEFGGSSISASLAAAAAAATLINPLNTLSGDVDSETYHDYDEENEFSDDNYEYSEYGDENDDGSEILSDYIVDEDEEALVSEFEDNDENFEPDNNPSLQQKKDLDQHINHDANDQALQHHHSHHYDEIEDSCDDDGEGEENNISDHDEEYESDVDEANRLEEGRKLMQIAITKLLQGRIMESYHATEAENNRLKLLQELEDEKKSKEEKKEKKRKKREKEKEKKKQQQLAREGEKQKKIEEQERIKKEEEERESERREAQRKKVEEAKRKKDEERKHKLEEQRKREELQERQRKQKEKQKRQREEERRKKDDEKKKLENEKKQKQLLEKEQKLLKEEEVQYENKFRILRRDTESNENQTTAPAISNKSTTSAGYVDKTKLHTFSDDIAGMVGAATAANSMSASASHLQDLLQSQSHILSNQTANRYTHSNDIVGSQLPIEPNSLISNTSNLLTPPGLLPVGKSQFEDLYASSASIGPQKPAITTGLMGQKLEPSVWNAYSSTNTSNNMANILPQIESVTEHSPSVTPQNRMSSFGDINAPISQKKSFADELNSLTSMLSYSGLNDNIFSNTNSDLLWSKDNRTSISAQTPSTHLNNVGSNNIRSSVSAASMQPFMGSLSSNTGSIWNNNFVNHTPLANNSNVTSLDTATTSLAQTSPSDSNILLQSNFWSNPGTFDTSYMNASSPIPQQNNYSNSNSIFETIFKEYKVLEQNDLTQLYIPVDSLYHRIISLGIDYNTFTETLLAMQRLYGCELITNNNGQISHVRMTKKPSGTMSHASSTTNQINNMTY